MSEARRPGGISILSLLLLPRIFLLFTGRASNDDSAAQGQGLPALVGGDDKRLLLGVGE